MWFLDWPEEQTGRDFGSFRWNQPGSNLCLDFHGDPLRAGLTVFSDGNHHMALRECLDWFSRLNPDLTGIFYATTPPGPIVNLLRKGSLLLGNLIINVSPHVFIGPPRVLDKLVVEGYLSGHAPFVKNQGNVLLVGKGNPKKITSVSDLEREDVRLFLSNPDTEKASYSAYYQTLKAMGGDPSSGESLPDRMMARGQVLFGERIHHREAPQAVADGRADAAVVFYHLALRYVRIFPEIFEMIPLGGDADRPEPAPGNVISQTHMGLVGDGGEWGPQLVAFLETREAKEIYRFHGLIPF